MSITKAPMPTEAAATSTFRMDDLLPEVMPPPPYVEALPEVILQRSKFSFLGFKSKEVGLCNKQKEELESAIGESPLQLNIKSSKFTRNTQISSTNLNYHYSVEESSFGSYKAELLKSQREKGSDKKNVWYHSMSIERPPYVQKYSLVSSTQNSVLEMKQGGLSKVYEFSCLNKRYSWKSGEGGYKRILIDLQTQEILALKKDSIILINSICSSKMIDLVISTALSIEVSI